MTAGGTPRHRPRAGRAVRVPCHAVPAGGRITLVDVGAIALAIALGVGAWLFNPGRDARGARDHPTTTEAEEPAADDPAADASTTTAAADPNATTTAPADPTATTAPAPGPRGRRPGPRDLDPRRRDPRDHQPPGRPRLHHPDHRPVLGGRGKARQ